MPADIPAFVLPLFAALLFGAALFLGARGIDEAVFGEHRRSRARLDTIAASGAGAASGTATRSQALTRSRRGGRQAQRLRSDLRRAGLAWTLTDYLAMSVVAAASAGLLLFVIAGSVLFALAALLIGALLPALVVQRRAASRAKQFNDQLVGTIELIASSLRSGFGFMQSLEVAAREQADPIAAELRQTLREVDLGVSIEEALEHLSARMRDEDLDLVVGAVLVQRRVGGDLGEVLLNIAGMIRDRIRVRGEIVTLTAQARLSSWIVGLLPVALAAVMFALQPEQMSVMFTEPLGQLMLGGALTLEVIGFMLVRRVAQIDY